MAKNDSNLYAFLGVFLTVIGFLIVYATKKEDKYAMYYAKQGLVLFFAYIVAWVVMLLVGWVPFIGWAIDIILWIGLAVLWIFGMIYALSGKEQDIPLIGMFAKSLKL